MSYTDRIRHRSPARISNRPHHRCRDRQDWRAAGSVVGAGFGSANRLRYRPARIEYLKVENYRALRSVELRDITPLSVLLGPNGSSKSTVFDVFNRYAVQVNHGRPRSQTRRRHPGRRCVLQQIALSAHAAEILVSDRGIRWRLLFEKAAT
jgi:hypothetical protein